MPQMAPLYWLNLMITFTLIILTTNIIIYFYKTPKMEFNTSSIKTKKNWKW